jgi:3-methylcrotonyl-CoA carboxylase alpha subunit
LNKSEEIREKARIAAKAVDYWNAGTVEFLMDKTSGDFYFMEMNTRLQVEHPVSEMVSGLDLVELQLRVANGEDISPIMSNITKPQGHAIEARICAEDWHNGFLPQFGKIEKFTFGGKTVSDLRHKMADYDFELSSEQGAKGIRTGTVRADLGFGEGSNVSQFYDSMIGKVIVWGETREESLKRLEKTLNEFKLMGFETNLPFIRGVLKQPKFKDFSYSLDFFSEVQEEVIRIQEENPFKKNQILAGLVSELLKLGGSRLASFRLNQKLKKYLRLECDRAFGKSESGVELELEVEEVNLDEGKFHLKVYDSASKTLRNEFDFKVSRSENQDDFRRRVDIEILDSNSQSKQYPIELNIFEGEYYVYNEGQYWRIKDVTLRECVVVKEEPLNKEFIICPMSGIISKILVQKGDKLKKGDPILSVEAMKMEHKIFAGFDLEIVDLLFKEGNFVDLGEAAIKIKEI